MGADTINSQLVDLFQDAENEHHGTMSCYHIRHEATSSVGAHKRRIILLITAASACSIVFFVPFLVIAAIKGEDNEFCNGYWKNDQAAQLAGRVRFHLPIALLIGH